MKGHVHIPAADMLRLRDAIHEVGACSAWNQIRHMADPELKVALANDGNHWAEWQRIAVGERQDYCNAAVPGDCECHRRMGADFYFLPAGACLIGDAKQCTDPARNGLYVHSDQPREPDPEPNIHDFTGGIVGRVQRDEETPRATGGQQEHSEVLRAAGVPYHDDSAGEHECVLDALRQC